MWDGPGPRQGPRGGPSFRGDHRGEMFGGRDRPMPDYRGRDEMNMGHMGPRPHDLPSMDMRRMDGPPMRGRDMDPRDMQGREPNRDFFRRGEEPDFTLRRQYEISIRDKLMNFSGFPGPGRNLSEMGGRGMPPWDPNNKFNDIRDRESFQPNMPRFNNPNVDGRRGFPMDRNDGCRDMRDWQPMGTGDGNRYDMDLPPHENRRMDSDRRGGPPFNPRGEFDSDMDFRNRPGPSAEFRGRDRSPLRFGSNDVPSVDRARSDMPPDFSGPQRSEFMGAENTLRQNEYPESSDSPLTDYRSGEEMTLAEEWKNRQKEKKPFVGKSIGGVSEPNFPVGFGNDVKIRDAPPFQERNRPPVEFPRKDIGFARDERFPVIDLPPIGSKGPQENPPPEISKFTGPPGRENESEHWLGERPPKHIQNKSHGQERPHYHQEKNLPKPENQEPKDCFKGMEVSPSPARVKMELEHNFQSSNTMQVRDQDYRDIDYRTGSGRNFDYKHEDLQGPEEKLITESKPITPSKFSESGSQDQDYRSASVEEKVSNTISIIGIPKTATMEQILGAFAVRDGVPMQGMKIKNVVPGYSYDTAYVEFLNLEDAVHFMESNKGSLKVGTKTATMKFIQPDKHERVHESDHKVPLLQEPQLPRPDEPSKDFNNSNLNGTKPKGPVEPVSHGAWQRNSDLTPEAWQQQVDQQLQQQEREQLADSWGSRIHPPHSSQRSESVFKDSKTMIIKNVKTTTSVDTILKALDPFAYLDERNVRLVKGKPPGTKCFCFVDMDSHEQVTRLVELLTKPRPLYIDGVRVYAEVAKPLKNQSFRRDSDKPNSSILGYPPEPNTMGQLPFSQPPQFLQPPAAPPAGMTGDLLPATNLSLDPSISQGAGFCETQTMDPSFHAGGPHVPTESAGMSAGIDGQAYMSGSEIPDIANYLFDATSGFYYDPETTFYYDPNSRYFYNAQTQEYMYWDPTTKTYIPVPGGNSAAETQPVAMTAEDQAILSNPAADAPLEMKKPSVTPSTPADLVAANTSALEPDPVSAATPEKKEDDDSAKKDKDNKEDKPKSLAAVKIMKDMERWAKIQNRQKDIVRSPSPLLRTGMDDDRRQSKSADAGFAIFERKISGGDDLFKKPLAPAKKDEKSKRSMGSLGMLASDYAAGSDDEIEEDKEEAAKSSQSGQSDDREDKLTDWKKMACLLCRRQFPNKDALIRHQQLSDLHKQNMEIHLKIKRSKKELEALENQERELSAKESTRSPEQKKRKQQQQHNTWAGGSREMSKVSERPGLGAEPIQQRKKKEHVVWDHATYKQAVRKAMFARFKELD
ncbi:RNA-binding protein 6-like isoform X2 [Solea senegalensis]|uniref:RNA-binding protein 6-like isoform X2 n=1 Tax=Solea senegalensis TaxID=28829 RepID=A0AAV6QN40_SOLSE|nr:RNA-binding protein 6 isoform X1 [Solea senegalensis]KAG7494110.1 RNA-binding protein 6-like isoform X2 [Solea senegalensis]